jgi:hypothetical protein
LLFGSAGKREGGVKAQQQYNNEWKQVIATRVEVTYKSPDGIEPWSSILHSPIQIMTRYELLVREMCKMGHCLQKLLQMLVNANEQLDSLVDTSPPINYGDRKRLRALQWFRTQVLSVLRKVKGICICGRTFKRNSGTSKKQGRLSDISENLRGDEQAGNGNALISWVFVRS